MQRHELEHIIRASAGITRRNQFIISLAERIAATGLHPERRLTRLSTFPKI